MVQRTLNTVGFIGELADSLETFTDTSMTKGQNLFEEQFLDQKTVEQLGLSEDYFVIFDEGYEQAGSPYRLNWSVRIATQRDRRDQAIDALRPIVNEFVNKHRIALASFTIANVTVSQAPKFEEQVEESGKFIASAILTLMVITS